MIQNAYMDIRAEMSVIGSLLQDPTCCWLLDELRDEDFSRPDYQAVYAAARRLRDSGQAVDVVTVGNAMKGCGLGESLVSVMLMQAVKDTPSTANVKSYVGIVRECAKRRALKSLLEERIRDIGMEDADVVADKAMTELRGTLTGGGDWLTFGQVGAKAYEMLEAISSGELRSVPTPLPDLNRLLAGGFRAGELIVLAAYTGQGKSAFALEVARHAANNGFVTAMVSQEMSPEQYGLRAMSSMTGIDTGEMLGAKNLMPEQWGVLADTVMEMQHLPIRFTATAPTVEAVRRGVLRMRKVDLLIVDYIQILGAEGRYESERVTVSRVSRALKQLAMELHIPVLALSQFSRPPKGQTIRKPTLNDLKESGNIENDADTVILLSRPESDDDESIPPYYAGWVSAAEAMGDRFLLMDVAKQRMCSPGMVAACFSPQKMRFYTPRTGG